MDLLLLNYEPGTTIENSQFYWTRIKINLEPKI